MSKTGKFKRKSKCEIQYHEITRQYNITLSVCANIAK